jgi:hypothetical protein
MFMQAILELCYREFVDEMHDSNNTNSFRKFLVEFHI